MIVVEGKGRKASVVVGGAEAGSVDRGKGLTCLVRARQLDGLEVVALSVLVCYCLCCWCCSCVCYIVLSTCVVQYLYVIR